MLQDLFPKAHTRYTSLPVLGPCVGEFDDRLSSQGYHRSSRRTLIRLVAGLDRYLRQRGRRHIHDITHADLEACRVWMGRRHASHAGVVGAFQRFLEGKGVVGSPKPEVLSPSEHRVAAYTAYLEKVRGLATSTSSYHAFTARAFLSHLHDVHTERLSLLTASDIESFIRERGKRLNRYTLQHTVAQLRGFLRFLAATGVIAPGLDTQIDTPRVYRLERLPRALPWGTVQSLLRSIDRTIPIGRRDYAMFALMATYGLRASQVVALTLDDIHWREGSIQVPARKSGVPLHLPLTDSAGAALLDYLKRGRPSLPQREVFLRSPAPAGAIKPTAVTEAFQTWSRRSGLPIPYQGPHCIRHAYAVHLLRRGLPLKTIGDLLGHRSFESTQVYLRLNTEDLRGVALCLPRGVPKTSGQEGVP